VARRSLIMESMSTEVDLGQVHRFSTDEYHRLIEAGAFDEDARLELIDGLLVDMSPKTREHENAIEWLTRWLVLAVDADQHAVRVGAALTLETSEPEPDLMVFDRSTPRPYHPASAALVIEVSVSSLRRDVRQKPPLYARAGVTEYWVVDLDHQRLVVHRGPRDNGYAEIAEIGEDGRLAASAVALPELDVGELLRAAAA
jgi:Uma2 family endonuclease